MLGINCEVAVRMRGARARIQGNGMLYLLAVQAAAKFVQLPRKPPVTTTLIAAQTLIYLRPGKLDEILPALSEVCLNPYLILKVRAAPSFSLVRFLCSILQMTY